MASNRCDLVFVLPHWEYLLLLHTEVPILLTTRQYVHTHTHSYTHTHTLQSSLTTCLISSANVMHTYIHIPTYGCIYTQTDILIYIWMEGAEPQMPHCIASLWLFCTFLDKSSLENYLVDKMLHKRGVTEDSSVSYKFKVTVSHGLVLSWCTSVALSWI